MRKEQQMQKRRCGDATMMRDNLAGLIDPMVNRAGAHPLGRSSQSRTNRGMLQVHRVGDRRSEAILAQDFSLENGAPGRKSKWPGFAVTTAAQELSCGWDHIAPESSDDRPPCLKKSPPRRGGIYALTENVALHFTLN
jgi:hypothetical protein